MSRALGWWRHVALGGAVAGLLLAPRLGAPAGWLACLLFGAAAVGLVGRGLLAGESSPRGAVAGGWLACLLALGAVAGLGAGAARLAAIDAGALHGPTGAEVRASGFVAAVAKRSFGEVRVPLDTPEGRVLVVAREPVGELPVGSALEVRGRLAPPADPFRRSELERLGAALELDADGLRSGAGGRAGLRGALDRVRARAEEALGEGVEPEQAALARGFVLGQDDSIDPETREAFKRSGLAHLLAVSGQNVMLLAILAGVILAAFGVPLRARLLLTVALIALYVPVAGGGPSIARAGVMGAAGILATLAARPSDRAYLTLLAAAATLLLNPRFGSDVGWQLSFAAVVGIMLWAAPLRALIAARLSGRVPARVAAPLAEGAALTLAATVATAPLMAHHFERLSLAAVPANLLVLPAVAPVMWLGMLIALLGQLPLVPLGPLGAIEVRLLDYVAWVADLFSAPAWAQVSLPLPGAVALAGTYAVMVGVAALALALARRRRGLRVPRRVALALSAAAFVAVGLAALRSDPLGGPPPPATLRITELDVGQGDSILLEPPRGDPVLVDGGPPGDAAAEALRRRGIERLRAVFVTHDQLDHAGGLFEVLETAQVGELIHARPVPELEASARAAGARVLRTAEGSSFEFGRLGIDVLWPPRDGALTSDPNLDSMVLRAGFEGYDALLTGDAEAEGTHLDPGPLDVLKVAHHGSDDAGLEGLLERSVPRVALIGVGADNTYGHPTPTTIGTLAEHGICTLRTDLDGAATVELGPAGVAAWTAHGPPPAERPGCGASPPG